MTPTDSGLTRLIRLIKIADRSPLAARRARRARPTSIYPFFLSFFLSYIVVIYLKKGQTRIRIRLLG